MSWKTEFNEAFRNLQELASFLDSPLPQTTQPIFIPRSLAIEIKRRGPASALWKQFIPNQKENDIDGLSDPISDEKYAVTKQLIHRYPNRALLIPTTICPVQCRYCFRKNELHEDSWIQLELEKSLTYLREHPEIEEIILTGGDPFILDDQKLEKLFESLAKIESLKFFRIHSRVPSVLPSRITPELVRLLEYWSERFSLSVVVHTNHVEELTLSVREALKNLSRSHFFLMSQSVLLKGVNDKPESLINLFKDLSLLGVQPYYLHHPDPVKGGMHFMLSLQEGRQLYERVKNQLSGWMVPKYVVDLPEGRGKTYAYNPESLEFSGTLRDRKGQDTLYPLR